MSPRGAAPRGSGGGRGPAGGPGGGGAGRGGAGRAGGGGAGRGGAAPPGRGGRGGAPPGGGRGGRDGAPTAGTPARSAAKAPPPRRWTAIAHPGLEKVVAAELAEQGFPAEVGAGELRFEADAAAVVAALPRLRTPDRLLLEVVRGRAYTLDELAALVRRADWRSLLLADAPLEVSLTLTRSRLHFRDSTEKKIAWSVTEALKGPRLVDGAPRPKEPQRVQARIVDDEVTISLDAGGLLHRRGWKHDVAKAPLRENLAAALLRISGWSPELPLLDPFCGSGTLVIEAALAASGRSPFVDRSFACAEWPFVAKAGARAAAPRPAAPRPAQGPADPAALTRAWLAGRAATATIIGSDRDPHAINAAMENARRAKAEIRFQKLDVGDIEPVAPTGFIVTNPPWGIRLGDGARGPDAGSIYSRFGAVIRERFDDWTVLFLAPEASLATRVGRDVRRVADFTSGGVHIGVWRRN